MQSRAGRRKRWAGRIPFVVCWVVLQWWVAGGWVSGQNADKRVALVIGVDQYTRLGEHAQLNVAVKDAQTMARALQSVNPPFEVTLMENADWRDSELAFEKFLDQASSASCALIYFAGHGMEYHGANFLLVRDTDIPHASSDVERIKRRLAASTISLQSWVDSLDRTGAQVKVVILDCCRDNPLRVELPSGTRSIIGGNKGLAQVNPPSGTLISYSADAGQQANDGLFTEVLARQLQAPGVPLLQVFAATREEVSAISTQWAQEDAANGIPMERRRVHHEPAEYTKLNLAGTKFTFHHGEAVAAPAPAAASLASPGSLFGSVGSMMSGQNPSPAAGTGTPGIASQPGNTASPPTPGQAVDESKIKALSQLHQAMLAARQGEGATPAPAAPTGTPSLLGQYAIGISLVGSQAGENRVIQGVPMVWCPPGTFSMGAPEGEEKWEEHDQPFQATLTRGFWIGKHEVTQELWQKVMGSSVAEHRESERSRGRAFGEVGVMDARHPMYFVSWDNAQLWVSRMNESHPLPQGYRWALPTEAQWEYACRAGTTTPYAFGRVLNGEQANCDGNFPYGTEIKGPAPRRTVEVGSYPPNAWGIHDMHGNVSEWCQDWFAPYPAGAVTDPLGGSEGRVRTIRGGGWNASALGCRSAYRAYGTASESHAYTGFRPVIVAVP